MAPSKRTVQFEFLIDADSRQIDRFHDALKRMGDGSATSEKTLTSLREELQRFASISDKTENNLQAQIAALHNASKSADLTASEYEKLRREAHAIQQEYKLLTTNIVGLDKTYKIATQSANEFSQAQKDAAAAAATAAQRSTNLYLNNSGTIQADKRQEFLAGTSGAENTLPAQYAQGSSQDYQQRIADLQKQAQVVGMTEDGYRRLRLEISQLEAEYTRLTQSAGQAQATLGQLVNAPIGNTFNKLTAQVAGLKNGINDLNFKSTEYIATLTRVKELETVASLRQNRLNVVADNQAYSGATLASGYGATANLPSLPNTLAADSLLVSELSARIQNLDKGSEQYLQTVKDLDIATKSQAASQGLLNRELNIGKDTYNRITRRDAKLIDRNNYFNPQGTGAPQAELANGRFIAQPAPGSVPVMLQPAESTLLGTPAALEARLRYERDQLRQTVTGTDAFRQQASTIKNLELEYKKLTASVFEVGNGYVTATAKARQFSAEQLAAAKRSNNLYLNNSGQQAQDATNQAQFLAGSYAGENVYPVDPKSDQGFKQRIADLEQQASAIGLNTAKYQELQNQIRELGAEYKRLQSLENDLLKGQSVAIGSSDAYQQRIADLRQQADALSALDPKYKQLRSEIQLLENQHKSLTSGVVGMGDAYEQAGRQAEAFARRANKIADRQQYTNTSDGRTGSKDEENKGTAQVQRDANGNLIGYPYRMSGYEGMGDAGLGQFGPSREGFDRRVGRDAGLGQFGPAISPASDAGMQQRIAQLQQEASVLESGNPAYNKRIALIRELVTEQARLKSLNSSSLQGQATVLGSESAYRQRIDHLQKQMASVKMTSVRYKELRLELIALEDQYKKLALVETNEQVTARKRAGLKGQLKDLGRTATSVAAAGFFAGPEGLAGATIGGVVAGPAGAEIGAAVGLGVQQLRMQATAVAEMVAELNLAKTALAQVSTGQADYNQKLQFARQVSTDYSVGLQATIDGYAKITAAATANGLTLKDTEAIYKGLLASGVAFGASQDDLQSIITATTQILSKGKISAEELSGQLGERIPGAVAKFAQATGRPLAQLAKDLQDGKVSIADFVKFAKGQLNDYDNAAKLIGSSPEKAGERLNLALTRMAESYGGLFQVVGSGFQDVAAKFINWISSQEKGIKTMVGLFAWAAREMYKFETNSLAVKALQGIGNFANNVVKPMFIPANTIPAEGLPKNAPEGNFFADRLADGQKLFPTYDPTLFNQSSSAPILGDLTAADDKAERQAAAKADKETKLREQLDAEERRRAELLANNAIRLADRVFEHQQNLIRKRYELENSLIEATRRAQESALVGPAREALAFANRLKAIYEDRDRQVREVRQNTALMQQGVTSSVASAENTARYAEVPQSAAGMPINVGAKGTGAEIATALKSALGLTNAQVAGIVGNLMRESGLNPRINEGGAVGLPRGVGGYGLAQWTGSRQTDLVRFAGGRSQAGDMATQLRFLVSEMRGPESNSLTNLRTAQSPEQAALLFDKHYERSGIKAMDERKANARQVFNQISGTTLARTQPGVASGKGRFTTDMGDVRISEANLLNARKEQELVEANIGPVSQQKVLAEVNSFTESYRSQTKALRDQQQELTLRNELMLKGVRSEVIDQQIKINQLTLDYTEKLKVLQSELGTIDKNRLPDQYKNLANAIALITSAINDQRAAQIALDAASNVSAYKSQTKSILDQTTEFNLSNRLRKEGLGSRPEIADQQVDLDRVTRTHTATINAYQTQLAAINQQQNPMQYEAKTAQINEETAAYKEQIAAQEALNKAQNDKRYTFKLEESVVTGIDSYIISIGTLNEAVTGLTQKGLGGLTTALKELATTGATDFRSFAISMLTDMTEVILQQLVVAQLAQMIRNILGGPTSVIGGDLSSFSTASPFKFAEGGVMTDKGPLKLHTYARGGIANTPQLAMFGEGSMPEAYVPLPDGKRIPVAMQGGKGESGGGVNVSVNVDASGSSAQGNEQKSQEFGKLLGDQIMAVIVREKRPGGTLYGDE
jgi:lambda family phage tail tape measure protein